jgi:transcriptional regulator with XRE-family HTH domain
MMITPGQVKAARQLLGWSRSELGGQMGVSESTIAKFENGKPRSAAIDLAAVRAALESAGVIFVEENGEGPGVRLRKVTGEPA